MAPSASPGCFIIQFSSIVVCHCIVLDVGRPVLRTEIGICLSFGHVDCTHKTCVTLRNIKIVTIEDK